MQYQVLFVFILALFAIPYSLFPKISFAQIPPPYVECDDTSSPEFHSLRPYQASPCNPNIEDTSRLCGNDMLIRDEFNVGPGDGSCSKNDRGTPDPRDDILECNFNIRRNLVISVDTSSAKLPIAGNTDLAENSQDKKSKLSDADKVNEYLSWYLNGVINRAENPPLSYDTEEDIRKLIDFSGPLRKLFPSRLQNDLRVIQIRQAKGTRHNQVVACTLSFAGLPIGSIPIPCYSLLGQITAKEQRLAKWSNEDKQPPKEEDFDNFRDYYVAYREWRGEECIVVTIPKWLPIIGNILGGKSFLFCANNSLSPDFYGDLFPYIPFSSTEDRKGKLTVSQPEEVASDVAVDNIQFSGETSAELFFPHLEGLSQISSALPQTYLPQGIINKAATNVESPEIGANCQILQVRSNEGDRLFGETTRAKFGYNAKFGCNFPVLARSPSCNKSVTFTSKINVDTPAIETSWLNLVAGNASIFKRIFPRLGTVEMGTIIDIPTTSQVIYSSTATETSPSSAEIYFPHLGGLKEYFLTGIQTMLRPKGYGEQITFGQATSGVCAAGEGFPNLPKASGSCNLGGVSPRVGNIPQSLKDIVSAAAETYKVPPNLILGVMYGEGIFNPGKYNWTDENVKNWATCESIPNCDDSTSADDSFLGFFKTDWNTIKEKIKPDLQKLDPNRQEPSRCNLLDAIYGTAWDLHDNADGSPFFPVGAHCYQKPLNRGMNVPSSCSWDDSQYESAIRVWEFGTGWGQTPLGFLTCTTKENSCASGGGINAQCPTDTASNFDTCKNNTSHNACVWDVGHGN